MSETKKPPQLGLGICFKKLKGKVAILVVIVGYNKSKETVSIQYIVRKRPIEHTTTMEIYAAIEKGELVLLTQVEARAVISTHIEGYRRNVAKLNDLVKEENDIVNTFLQCRKHIDGVL